MLEIVILGPGCANCRRLEQLTRRAAAELGIETVITKVTDYADIIAYNVIATPGLVIDKRVVSSGRIPDKAEVIAWLQQALSPAAG